MSELEKIIEIALGQAPFKAGQKVCSERKIAEIMGEDRMRVNRALNSLTQKGVLVRKHGSGTYIRKISKLDGTEDKELLMRAGEVSGKLVADSGEGFNFPVQQSQLTIGLWGNLHCTTKTNLLTFQGIDKKIKELGHRLVVESMLDENNGPLMVETIAERLSKSSCDGYIVASNWAWVFRQAYIMVFGNKAPPIAYIYVCSCPVEYEPMVLIDTAAATERAVRIFKREGFSRIGMLINENPVANPRKWQEDAYVRSMMLNDLKYRAIESVTSTVDLALDKLLKKNKNLEAIYISDDNLLREAASYFQSKNIVPGKDIFVITLSIRGVPLPDDYKWSKLEFCPVEVGSLVVESLLREISTAREELCSFSNRPSWHPGETHRDIRKMGIEDPYAVTRFI
jgi:hypothetical protein